MSRRNWVLAGLLVVQVVVAAVVLWPRGAETAGRGVLLEGVDGGAVTSVAVEDGSSRVQLARTEAGWVLPEAGDYPVQEANVTRLISTVLAIDTGRLVATTPANHARLKVAEDDFARRIELQQAGGDTTVLLVGTSPNANTTHVRRSDQDAVYLAPGAVAGDARSDLAAWIDTQYLATNAGDVRALTVQNGSGSYTFSREEGGAWALAGAAPGEALDQAAVDALTARLASITLTRPLGRTADAAYGLDAPQATVTVTTQPAGGTPTTTTLAIGAATTDDSSYTVKSSASDFYVTVPQFQLKEFVDKDRTAFVLPPATPAATTPFTATQVITPTGIMTK